ncbi:MAG: NADH-quinone oxidoreductase subunit N [Candidatus Omnitrophica bacterium]|nr:NADH-quinone oxidoreductase subunit N [Candidatus Omnitrophota bacterium]
MNLLLFLPETWVLITVVFLLGVILFTKENLSSILYPSVFLSAIILVLLSSYALFSSGELFYSTYRIDLLSQGFKWILSLCFLFTILFSRRLVSIHPEREAEYFFFLCTATLGMMMLTSAMDVLTLYISLELSSYSLYLLASLRESKINAESSVKYLVFGAAASGLLLWGLSLITGLSGSTFFSVISKDVPLLMEQPAFALGMVLASLAFFFKLSSFPMHFWAPDVYECAATPVTSFVATASKAAAVAVLIRFFILLGISQSFVVILGVIAFVSMTLGNAIALLQQDVKRLLAYSSIAQAGYILVGLLAGSFEGYSSSFFYAFSYVLMNAGAFLVTVLIAQSERHDNPGLVHFDGLAERSPFLALILLLSLLSLAGIPPLIGFTGKWILFAAAMDKGHWFLVLWGVLNSVVSLFYYLTLVKHAYLEKPRTSAPIPLPLPIKILGLALFCGIVFLGIYPKWVISFAQTAISKAMLL